MPGAEPPVVKLVLAAGPQAWTGLLYPTQIHRGGRHAFSSLAELLAAVADLLRWELPPPSRSGVGSDERADRRVPCRPGEVAVSDLRDGHPSPEQKLACVLGVLHGDVSVVDAARSAGVPVQAVVEWRQAVLAAGLLALGQAPDAALPPRTGALVDGSGLLPAQDGRPRG